MRKVVLAIGAAMACYLAAQGPGPVTGPVQPIPYSHKHHVGTLKLKCTFCHENKDPGEFMGIPETAKCMGCHKAVKTDSPSIAKLAELHEAKRPVPWVRIYQIPSFVFFSHRAHVQGGATCTQCHGPVEERETMRKEVPTNMGACMDCHQKSKVSNDCMFCHEQRN